MLGPISLGGVSAAALPDSFSISTWNVWFDKHQRERRFAALLDILKAHDPEIMAFQEVTPPFVRAVQDAQWLREHHWISAVDHNNLGTVVVSRVQPLKLEWVVLPSKMGRRMLSVDFPTGLKVGVCHLESLDPNEALRREQLQVAFAALKPAARSLLLGDFNFSDRHPEVSALDPAFNDAWPTANPEDPGFTRDTVANPMARFGREDKQDRLDRILFRGRLRLTAIERLGTEPLEAGLFPSDHFGLLAHLAQER